jgi:hypothetical protein
MLWILLSVIALLIVALLVARWWYFRKGVKSIAGYLTEEKLERLLDDVWEGIPDGSYTELFGAYVLDLLEDELKRRHKRLLPSVPTLELELRLKTLKPSHWLALAIRAEIKSRKARCTTIS